MDLTNILETGKEILQNPEIMQNVAVYAVGVLSGLLGGAGKIVWDMYKNPDSNYLIEDEQESSKYEVSE